MNINAIDIYGYHFMMMVLAMAMMRTILMQFCNHHFVTLPASCESSIYRALVEPGSRISITFPDGSCQYLGSSSLTAAGDFSTGLVIGNPLGNTQTPNPIPTRSYHPYHPHHQSISEVSLSQPGAPNGIRGHSRTSLQEPRVGQSPGLHFVRKILLSCLQNACFSIRDET